VSAPLLLTSTQLADLGKFLDALTKATCSTGCNVTPYGPITVSIGDNHGVQVRWDADLGYDGEYVIDEQVGS
jgi:hypothetical protein